MTPTYSPAQLQQARRDFEAVMFRYFYDGENWRYRSGAQAGQIVPIEDFEQFFDAWLQERREEARAIATRLLDHAVLTEQLQQLTFPELKSIPLQYRARGRQIFIKEMQELLKRNHAIAWLIGTGGLDNLTPRDKIQLQARLRSEFRYLDGFKRHLKESRTIADVIARARMYGHSLYGTWQQGRLGKARRDGFLWKRNILEVRAIHCEGCPRISALGWVRIDHRFPPPGISKEPWPRQCLSNCRCRLEFSKAAQRPTARRDSILDRKVGWLGKQSVA